MASVRITEFANLHVGMEGQGSMPQMPSVVKTQLVTIGTEAKSAAFNADTRFVRVQAEALCCITIGDNLTADTGDIRFTAGMTEYYGVSPGHKLSAITTT